MPTQNLPELWDLREPLVVPANGRSNGPEKLTIDDMLLKYCGEFGRWQLKHFVLTSLAWALEAFHTMVMIFADHEPRWLCTGPGCQVQAQLCELPPGSWDWVDRHRSSTVVEWGLVCGEKYKVGLVQALFFFGCMIGAGLFGHLSDSSLGRKSSLTIICLLNGILGCLTAFSPNYAVYTLLRFLSGLGTGGVGMCAFVLATEPIGPTKRGVAGMSAFYFFSAGIALLSGIAYVFQSWRSLYIASSIPSIVFIAIIVPFLSESPRWYLVRGKTKEAMKVMRHMALSNGTTIPQNVELILDDDANKSNSVVTLKDDDTLLEEAREVILKGSLLDVLMLPITRVRLLLAIMINFCCAIVYYGLSLNVVNLDTNLYINVLLNAIFELPSYTITAIIADKFGRKPVSIGTMWFSGVFCLLGSIIKSYGIWKNLRMLCGILGIFGMAGTYNLMFVYTMEMFPTVVRNTALGCTTQASQTGAILAPLVVMMGSTLPFAVFTVCGIVGGLLLFNLPETLNRPLYDTMAGLEEGEAILNNS